MELNLQDSKDCAEMSSSTNIKFLSHIRIPTNGVIKSLNFLCYLPKEIGSNNNFIRGQKKNPDKLFPVSFRLLCASFPEASAHVLFQLVRTLALAPV